MVGDVKRRYYNIMSRHIMTTKGPMDNNYKYLMAKIGFKFMSARFHVSENLAILSKNKVYYLKSLRAIQSRSEL